jgi:segregation and condensation protein B
MDDLAMESSQLKNIVEAALLAAGTPLTIGQLQAMFGDKDAPDKHEIRSVVKELQADYEGRGIEVREVASGFRIQVRDGLSQWLSKLWEERPPRYSRALMETLAIIAYRQPVTRGDIEEIRGVAVTSNIIRTLLEREWIKVVGHRDVPGKPAMFGSTRNFLDYFSLKKLEDLPPLAELAELEPMGVQLELNAEEEEAARLQDTQTEVAPAAPADADEVAEGIVGEDPESAAEGSADVEEGSGLSFDDDDYDDDEVDLTDEELAAATAKIDAITAELNGKKNAKDEANETQDVPPGGVAPLVGLNAPGEEPPEPATVSSLDDARAAAADKQDAAESDPAAQETGNEQSAEIVPLKTS